jgi:LuxR family maltose regulon positive regulatory protein
VSASAGFGKTTLLAEWLAADPADGRSAAWLSLDQRDNDPAVFWPYLIVLLVGLLIVSFVPWITLVLPEMFLGVR